MLLLESCYRNKGLRARTPRAHRCSNYGRSNGRTQPIFLVSNGRNLGHLMILNGWSGAHFIADRNVGDYGVYVVSYLRRSPDLHTNAYALVPTTNVGRENRVQTKAAAAADADLLIEGVILATEG